jgi:quinol monooxygenase YgiN
VWAQLIKFTLKPGHDDDLPRIFDQLQGAEQNEGGHISTVVLRSDKNPSDIYAVVTFESEEKARAREQDEARQESLKPLREFMAQAFEGPPEFTDATVIGTW